MVIISVKSKAMQDGSAKDIGEHIAPMERFPRVSTGGQTDPRIERTPAHDSETTLLSLSLLGLIEISCTKIVGHSK